MPKYYGYKVCGYYLYFTSHCIVEAMHVHASDRKESERTAAKFFVKSSGVSDTSRQVGNVARQISRQFGRSTGARTHSAASDCIVRTVSFGADPLKTDPLKTPQLREKRENKRI